MNAIKAVYMPIRRYFFLEDDEDFHISDLNWIIGVPTSTVAVVLVCFIATFNN